MAKDSKNAAHLKAKRANNFWGTTLRLVRYMSTRFWGLAATFILVIGATILATLAPYILGKATTEIYRGIQEGRMLREAGEVVDTFPIDFDYIKNILITVAIVYITQAVFRYFQQYITAHIAQKTVYDMRKDLKEKMSTLSIEYYDTHSNGDIMSRAVNDMDQIANTLQQSLTQFIMSVVQFVTVLIVMFSINIQLTLVTIVTVPISFLLIAFVAPKSQKQFAAQQKELGVLNDQVEETYSGHTIVKTYNREEDEIEKFVEQSAKLNEASWKAQFLTGIMMPLVSFARDLGYFGVAIIGGIGVANGTVSLGNVQAFIQYVNQFSQPVRQLANLANTIQVTIASCERIFEVLDEDPMKETESGLEPRENTNYKIEFENVEFGYGQDDLLMTDFNLTVKEGQMIAVVGPTGAGKSTLINLLERFYDVKGGSIRYEGVDTRDIKKDKLRNKFSMVLQDTWLFNGTIWENLRYGSHEENPSDQEILEAAEAAHVDDFVRRLPEGYDTMLNEEGTNISQGQRQLITIARAFLADPEVLILDEATSSVDTRTEILIQRAMGRLLENRTSFVVAHRLSTIRDADKIIVMNHGDVIETGNHEELIEQDGFYADLYNAQFQSTDEQL
ncbi:MAG: ABC transporter ATP-binding protein/permease [Alkalibacterium sp.]|uniref:ABC transporter ATP-binding protein n=1 Tax=Alkalibacterium TaxID=99906 RepID=UPI002647BD2D|nr:ABC transporter ATP-binding protein [Alkalibacterium sp.]MDN6193876.1 ABC transporter ATP-binding protein/permease [Alkalibacterium sp.]MDN6293984.1 ABC transporter ATP-binding protein/permease [Alkalibacterium sp.]MDN6296218.1 ABC transporter ATP-binding protein/permease [Alkalibacterium sp.]MDN6326423.1 ABC transporter ATP-binding protein/permease [Alkalibacterium sp.]MDN6398450.1 ABC transporter ATP-binding protein/permease [Alkalibacterium sp.]